jgi:hypothetical protein
MVKCVTTIFNPDEIFSVFAFFDELLKVHDENSRNIVPDGLKNYVTGHNELVPEKNHVTSQ